MRLLKVGALHGSILAAAGFVMGVAFLVGFWHKKQEMRPDIVYKCHGATFRRQMFVSLVGRAGVLLTMQRVKNIFGKGSCLGCIVS